MRLRGRSGMIGKCRPSVKTSPTAQNAQSGWVVGGTRARRPQERGKGLIVGNELSAVADRRVGKDDFSR
jgi:hypothetical protein